MTHPDDVNATPMTYLVRLLGNPKTASKVCGAILNMFEQLLQPQQRCEAEGRESDEASRVSAESGETHLRCATAATRQTCRQSLKI